MVSDSLFQPRVSITYPIEAGSEPSIISGIDGFPVGWFELLNSGKGTTEICILGEGTPVLAEGGWSQGPVPVLVAVGASAATDLVASEVGGDGADIGQGYGDGLLHRRRAF